MENLLDLLIILFIIYAFLAPILKKKSPPAQKKPMPYEPESSYETREEKSSQEILREIEELFGYSTEAPEPVSKQEDEEFKFFELEPEKIQKTSEAKFEEKFLQESPEIKKDEKIAYEYNYGIEAYDYEATIPDTDIENFDYSKLDIYNIETEGKLDEERAFQLELSGIDDFKKAVIYKEIFDTPIALRMRRIKWQRNIY